MWIQGRTEIMSKAKEIAGLVQDLSLVEKRGYSFSRAILQLGEDPRGGASGLEKELSDAIAAKLGVSTSGMWCPTNMHIPTIAASGLDTRSNSAGLYTVATEIKDLIELLRARTRVIQMGATVLSGLQGNIQFPTQSAASSGAWMAQNSGTDAVDSDATFGVKSLTPHIYIATTSFSRQMLAQSTIDVENFVRNDLSQVHALAIDKAAICGDGTSNAPTGITKTLYIGSVAIGTDGGVPTWAVLGDLETAVASANADEAGMKYLTTPGIRGKLRKTGKLDSTYSSQPAWESTNIPGIGSLQGYPAYVSSQVPSTLTKGSSSGSCHAIIFGYWPSLMIAEWGVIELIVDPYRLKKQGLVEVTSHQMIDIGLRQVAQFAACLDAKVS
jgi:HK97 family phage major capsid protein